ncbi:hypothetical protein ACET3Z_027683 [Daucus carota]
MFNVNQKGLMEQDLSNLDVITLHPLSPEVISRQATINIGTTTHLAHGKSTAVKAISGVQTICFKNEFERNITIKLGYANAKYINVKMTDVLDQCVTRHMEVENKMLLCAMYLTLRMPG